MNIPVLCEKTVCFGNKGGLCKVLADRIDSKPCPFFKTTQKLVQELAALDSSDFKRWRYVHYRER